MNFESIVEDFYKVPNKLRKHKKTLIMKDLHNISFEYKGTQINNPFFSECGRFAVEPHIYYGQAFLDAYAVNKFKEVEALLRQEFKEITKAYDWQCTSWHNDTCLSISAIDVNLAGNEYTIQIFMPNHFLNDGGEQTNSYAIWVDDEKSNEGYYLNKYGLTDYLDISISTAQEVVESIKIFINKIEND